MALKVPLATHWAIALVLALLLSKNLYIAFAASGGVMGGSSFSSDSDSDSDSSSSYTSSWRSYDDNYYRSRQYGRTDTDDMSSGGNGDSKSSRAGLYVFVFFAVGVIGYAIYGNSKGTKSTILMVQIGLSGKARSLQRDLNILAKAVDTSTAKGWSFVLTETVLGLLRSPEYIISGHSSMESMGSLEEAEKHFNQLSIEERAKFDMETLVNVNSVKVQRKSVPKSHKAGKDYIVITILVAARGTYQLPPVEVADDLNKGVQVLWSPQDGNDVLSEEEYLKHYPLLRPV